VLFLSAVYPVDAAGLSASEYHELFTGVYVEGIPEKLKSIFLAAPYDFVQALAREQFEYLQYTLGKMRQEDWSTDPEYATCREALLQIAENQELSQSERRVVKYMLRKYNLAEDYLVYTDRIDYVELFSHKTVWDTNELFDYSTEVFEVFDRDATAFIKALAQEDEAFRDTVLFELMCQHYYHNYNGRDAVENALNEAQNSGKLNSEELQIIADFWAFVDAYIDKYGPLPPPPTTPPPTQPTTQALTASLSFDKHFFVTGEPVPIRISTNGQNCQLQITHPDGSLQTITPDEGQSVITLTFGHAGTYYIALTVQRGAERYTTDSVNIIVDAQPLSGPTTPSTTPKPIPEEKPLNIPTPWIIIGLVAVIFGVQAVAIVLYRKKSTPAEEDFDE
jgi:hypothetical protein